ncbi:MAG: FHA domain-containing serine/threonine-protein kinase [Acidobacteriota bacterium]
MPRCNECESEVTANDVFCPFCGISLQSDISAGLKPESDSSMERTMMMPVPEKEVSAVSDTAGDENQPAEAGAREEFNADDIPMPAILNATGKTADHILTQDTGEYNQDTFEEAASVGTVSADADAAAGHDEETVTTEPTVDVSAAASEQEEAEFDAAESVTDPAPDAVEISAGVAQAETQHADPTQSARLENKDIGISKPLDELPEATKPSNSVFDSVRIMENKPGRAQEDVDTRIQANLAPRLSDMTPPVPPVPAVLVKEPKVEDTPPRSATGPSTGLGDTDGRRSAKLKPLSEGAILNSRYEIVRKIGGGGMGAVYLASDNNLGGVLRAVKEMIQAHIEEEQQDKAVNDFKRESMILSSLDHPSIPTIFDYFYDEKEGRFYLVMKYISGGDLAARLRSAPEGKIEETTATEWALQIIDVLDYLHNQPSTIVYRDLKPSNIMVDGNSGRVMLIDFGIARSISQKEEKGVTAVGTMGYAPPELFSGHVEPRSDIYSLGSTMFHLMTGADPQSNPLLIFDFQKNPRPRQINPRLSDQMERILMRSVEYNADARFSSAAEMRAVLDEHLINLKTGNLTYGVSEAPASISLANQSVFCGFCGQRIVATDMFCAFCGAKQPLAQQGVHSEIYTQAAGTVQLIVEGTSELTNPAYPLQKDENLLGRRDPMSNIFPEVDLSKYDPQTKISRRHARIWREGNKFLLEDLGSSNGTILASPLNESLRLAPRQPHILSSGDKIKIGDTTLHFLVN